MIGKGKHSKVWKARERKTIHFYALKRVDCSTRSQKDRVEQEVRRYTDACCCVQLADSVRHCSCVSSAVMSLRESDPS